MIQSYLINQHKNSYADDDDTSTVEVLK